MSAGTIGILWFVFGALLSVLLPFGRELFDSGAAFEWRKLVGQLLAVVAVIAGQVIGISEQLVGASAVVAFAAGMGVSFMGRQAQKTYDALR